MFQSEGSVTKRFRRHDNWLDSKGGGHILNVNDVNSYIKCSFGCQILSGGTLFRIVKRDL